MFFSREDELASLSLLWKKNVSSFVTCRGRRRIGKCSLIEEFARRSKCRFFELVYAGRIDPQIAENGYFDALIPIEELLEINSGR